MQTVIIQPIVSVELTNDEALLFKEFQRNYGLIAPLVGYLDTLKLADLRNTSITLDIDNQGKVSHTSITKHYRA